MTESCRNGLAIHVFTFIFGEKEDQGFIAKDLCKTPPLHSMRWPSIGIYGDVALVVGSSHETGFLTIVLLDYRRQALYIMDSGILYHEETVRIRLLDPASVANLGISELRGFHS